jgi:ABC-2 type transport system ATP-binding protein
MRRPPDGLPIPPDHPMCRAIARGSLDAMTRTSPDTGAAVISVQHLRKTYGDIVAVDDVSFEVQPGEIFGILGPNGAGKTTTVESLMGLRRPDSGRISVLGLDPRTDRTAFTEAVGVQLQTSQLPEKIRVGEAIELYRSFYDDPVDGDELLDQLGLSATRRLRYGKLSGGQQQRLAIALALIGRPRIAVLDELTTGLDPQARRDTWDLIAGIRDRGATVVLVTHFMEEAEYLCDRLAVIDRGRVVAGGTTSELIEQATGRSRIKFRPAKPFPDSLLTELPEVTSLTRAGATVTITGQGEVLQAVTARLGRAGIVAHDLRVHQADLDDAFIALTGRGEPSDRRTTDSLDTETSVRSGAST